MKNRNIDLNCFLCLTDSYKSSTSQNCFLCLTDSYKSSTSLFLVHGHHKSFKQTKHDLTPPSVRIWTNIYFGTKYYL